MLGIALFAVRERERAVEVEEIPVALELGDAGVDAVGVLCVAAHDSARRPRAFHAGRGGVGRHFVEPVQNVGDVDHVVDAVALEEPRTLGVVRQAHHFDLAVKLDHVRLQLRDVKHGVPPREPRRAVVVDEDRRVHVVPADGAGRHAVPHERLADGVLERTFRLVGDGDADGASAVLPLAAERDVEPVFAVLPDRLGGPGVVGAPFERVLAGDGAVCLPVHHVLRGVAEPVVHDEPLARRSLVVRGVEVDGVAVHERGGVCGEDVGEERIPGEERGGCGEREPREENGF